MSPLSQLIRILQPLSQLGNSRATGRAGQGRAGQGRLGRRHKPTVHAAVVASDAEVPAIPRAWRGKTRNGDKKLGRVNGRTRTSST
ncbi:hypothetical protein E2C01_088812 [Portunus trituberculatus]|uniref:Uncharacterized protein n=1 Tax=Portunus trituberculatus TaxID=210409 RepID=A0A5B7JMW8_PORTR|nr:hypothetical protein [Portunus trituberculatus]